MKQVNDKFGGFRLMNDSETKILLVEPCWNQYTGGQQKFSVMFRNDETGECKRLGTRCTMRKINEYADNLLK